MYSESDLYIDDTCMSAPRHGAVILIPKAILCHRDLTPMRCVHGGWDDDRAHSPDHTWLLAVFGMAAANQAEMQASTRDGVQSIHMLVAMAGGEIGSRIGRHVAGSLVVQNDSSLQHR